MRRRLPNAAALALLMAPLPLAADCPPPREATDLAVEDLTEFQGRWQVVAMCSDGRTVPETRWKNLQWSFEGDRLTCYAGAMTCRRGRVHAEYARDPHELHVAFASGGSLCYVFRVRGDTLEVAQSESGGSPPTGFTPDRGCDVMFTPSPSRPKVEPHAPAPPAAPAVPGRKPTAPPPDAPGTAAKGPAKRRPDRPGAMLPSRAAAPSHRTAGRRKRSGRRGVR